MPGIVREKQRRAGENRAQSAFQNEGQYAQAFPFHRLLPIINGQPSAIRHRLAAILKPAAAPDSPVVRGNDLRVLP